MKYLIIATLLIQASVSFAVRPEVTGRARGEANQLANKPAVTGIANSDAQRAIHQPDNNGKAMADSKHSANLLRKSSESSSQVSDELKPDEIVSSDGAAPVSSDPARDPASDGSSIISTDVIPADSAPAADNLNLNRAIEG